MAKKVTSKKQGKSSSKPSVKYDDWILERLKKNKKEAGYFDTLSFSNKKEYIEWIVTAKREETRMQRIKETIEKLGRQWKNPRNI